MIRYRVTHRTTYEYELPVSLCHNVAHLEPRSLPGQVCVRSDIEVSPAPKVRGRHLDPFGNMSTYFSIETPHRVASVGAVSEVLVDDHPPLTPAGPSWETCLSGPPTDGSAPFGGIAPPRGEDNAIAAEFRLESPFVPLSDDLADYAWQCFTPGRPVLEAAADLTRRIHEEFTFDPDFTTVATPVMKVFQHKRGVCQDFAHVMLACLRSIGLAARYVSGYLETDPPPGQPRLEGADASHAWVSLHVPDLGWFDYDPTNNCRPGGRHIVVAVGRDYGDVTPLKGVILGGGRHKLKVTVDVLRIADEPVWPETAI